MPTFIKPDNVDTRAKGYKNWFNLDFFVKKIVQVFLTENPPISIPNNLQQVLEAGNASTNGFSILGENGESTIQVYNDEGNLGLVRVVDTISTDSGSITPRQIQFGNQFQNKAFNYYPNLTKPSGNYTFATTDDLYKREIKEILLVNSTFNLEAGDETKFLIIDYPNLIGATVVIPDNVFPAESELIIYVNSLPGGVTFTGNIFTGETALGNNIRVENNPTSNYIAKFKNIGVGDLWLVTYENSEFPIIPEIVEKGKITITDLQYQAFTNLASAIAWINTYTSATLTDTSYNNGVFKFTVPENTSFDLSFGFCSSITNTQYVRFEDSSNYIISFGDEAFLENKENNTLGFCTFGLNAFKEAKPSIKNTLKGIEFCQNNFGQDYEGRIDIEKFGSSGGQNLPSDIFTTNNLMWINTSYFNKFNNLGNLDADLIIAIANMTNPRSAVNYEGVNNEPIKIFFTEQGTATTTFTIPIPKKLANIDYVVSHPMAKNMLSSVNWRVQNKTEMQFEIVSVTELTGLVEIELTVTP